MMNTTIYTKRSWLTYLQLVVLGTVVLYFGRNLFIPLCYGLFIAIVLYPVCKWLEDRRWPRSLAITAGLLIVVVLFGALLALFVYQVMVFKQEVPALLEKLVPALQQLQMWLASVFNFTLEAQDAWWRQVLQNLGSNGGTLVRNIVSATSGTFITLFLVPVYAALFLYNRGTFVQFLASVSGNMQPQRLQTMLHEVIHTYFNFIKGMALVYLVVGILNSIGLLALGIKHAILFGMLTAIMTIIPYVGIFASALLPLSVAWLTKGSIWYPVGVVGVFALVQYLEANIIFPKIVGARLDVSTWATLVAVIAGGLLWGVSGMILFIPFIGILKMVLDYIPEGKALNILLKRHNSK
jgi:predicted PurR-regulated permease PerM